MKRAGWICLQNGFDVKVLGLSGMKDTADMVAEDPQIWVDAIKHSKPIVDFIINQVLDESIDQRRKIQKISTTLLPFIAIIQSSIEQAHYVKKVAELFSIPETAIYTELKAFTEKPQDSLKTLVPTETVTKKQISGREQREQSLVSLVFLQKNKPDIAPFNIKDAMVKIRGESSVEKLIEMYSGEMDSMLFQAEKLLADGSGEVVAKQLLRMYNLEYLDKQLYDIKQAIKASEQKEESIQSEELLIQYNNILALKKELLDKQ